MNRVLLVSLYGCWPDFVALDYRIKKQLEKYGCRVDTFLCGGELLTCDQTVSYREAYGINKDTVCKLCVNNTALVAGDGTSFRLDRLMRRLSGIERRDEDYEILVILDKMGVNLTSLCNQTRVSNRYYGSRLRKHKDEDVTRIVDSSFRIYDNLNRLLGREEWYDCAIMTHPHRSLMAVAERVLSSRGVPVIGYVDAGAGDQSSFVAYSMDENLIPRQGGMKPRYSRRMEIALSQGNEIDDPRVVIGNTYRVMTGESYAEIRNVEWKYEEEVRPDQKNSEVLPPGLTGLLRRYKSVVCMFTSTESENQATSIDPENDVQAWLRMALKCLSTVQKETLFIIREHPNRYKSKVFRDPELSYWFDYMQGDIDTWNDNLLILHPWDAINVHRLLGHVDIAICPLSSIAMDAYLYGCRVVVGPYSQFTKVADVELECPKEKGKEYADIIGRLIAWMLTERSAGRIREFNENKVEALVVYAASALPFFKIDRESLRVNGTEKDFGEIVTRYIQKSNEASFNDVIHDLVYTDEIRTRAKKLKKESVRSLLTDTLIKSCLVEKEQAKASIDSKRSIETRKCSKRVTIQKGLLKRSVSELDDFVSIQKVGGVGIGLEDLETDADYVLTDCAVLDGEGLLRSGWDPSYNSTDLRQKLGGLLDLEQENVAAFILCRLLYGKEISTAQTVIEESWATNSSSIELMNILEMQGVIEFWPYPVTAIWRKTSRW